MTYLDRPQLPRGKPWAHNTLGAVVHLALHRWWQLARHHRTPANGGLLVERNWQSDGFRDEAQSADWRGTARTWVEGYLAETDAHAEPVGVERTVATTTSRLAVSGRVDRIDDRDGDLVIVDYKTGRHGLTVDDARGSQALALYALATARTLRRDCRRVELHHLPTGEVLAWEHTAESLGRHLARAEEAADELALVTDTHTAGGDAEVLFPPRTGRHCSWCDFRRHCPEGRQAAPDLDPWAALLAR